MRDPVDRATQAPGGLHTTAPAALRIVVPAVHVMQVLELLATTALVALRIVVPAVLGTTALAALRMMVLVARHIQGLVVHAMRAPVDRATQAQEERAGSVQPCANDNKSIQGACHLTTACRATRRRWRAPEAGRSAVQSECWSPESITTCRRPICEASRRTGHR